MKVNRLFMVMVMIGVVLASAGMANAACTQYGKIVYVFIPESGNNGRVYISRYNLDTPTYYYWFRFPVDHVGWTNLFSSALAGHNEVQIRGDEGSCPNAGTERYGGNVEWAYQYLLR